MYILIAVITILLTWKYAKWKDWKKYQATMLFYPFGNLIYCFVYHDKFLWKFKPDFFNHHIMEVAYSYTVYPLVVLLFLSLFPKGLMKQIIHISKYIVIFVVIEYVLSKTGYFVYNYGWNIWWSLAWNCITFPILILHYKKPLAAYTVGVVLIFLMNWIFPMKLN